MATTNGNGTGTGKADGWQQTACSLCYVNCGIEVRTDGRSIIRVRGDKAHPHSAGYLCQKAQRLTWYGRGDDRLTTPLRRRPDGTHEPIGWDQALDEIAAELARVRAEDEAAGRPSSFAVYGGGGQGNHSGGAYVIGLQRWLGSDRYYNALGQEKTGDFWVNGRMFGKENVHTAEGMEDADLLIVLGCNPWMAHGFRNARSVVNGFKNDPGRRMIVIDPRRTETADAADLHLSLRPGTDAFLLAAMLRMLVDRGAHDVAFLADRTAGFEDVTAALARVPVEEWVAHAEVPLAQVEQAVEMIEAATAMTVRAELGIQQGRHSTLNSYLEKLLFLLTGNFGRPGTNAVHSWLYPLWGHSDGQRSPVTGVPQIAGLYPPNTLGEEILTDHPDRIRVLWVESGNPANTAADTVSVEAAIRATELSVVVDVAYTETAQLADYVLPAASQHEKSEFTMFTFEFPTNYFQLRRPLFTPLPGTLPEAEAYTRLLERLGALDGAPTDELRAAAQQGSATLSARLMEWVASGGPTAFAVAPTLAYRALAETMPPEEAHAAGTVLMFSALAALTMPTQVARALGPPADPGDPAALAELLYERILDSPSGVAFSEHLYEEMWEMIPNERVQLAVPELLDWLGRLDPAAEARDPRYPFSLLAGQRRSYNANQIMRNPGWRKSDVDGALRVHPDDLAELGIEPDGWAAVSTPTGRIVVRAEVDDSMRRGQAALPHGYGMSIPDGRGGRVRNGPRINLLTAAHDRDPIAGTPHHKDVPVHIEPATEAEAAEAGAASATVHELAAAGLAAR